MASPSERLSSEGSGGWTATRSRAELLVSVRARGTRIRRRRRTIVVGTLAAVSVVLLAPLVFSQRDVGRQLTAEGGPVTTPAPGDLEAVPTSSPPLPIRPGDADEPQQAGGSMGRPGAGSSSSTTTTGGTAGATGADGTDSATGEPLDGAASLPAGSVSTTTTDPRCRQSHDPTCGPFFWMDPLPPDVHPAITLTANPDPPVAGIPVTFVFSVYLRRSFNPLDQAITVLNALSRGDTSAALDVGNAFNHRRYAQFPFCSDCRRDKCNWSVRRIR